MLGSELWDGAQAGVPQPLASPVHGGVKLQLLKAEQEPHKP